MYKTFGLILLGICFLCDSALPVFAAVPDQTFSYEYCEQNQKREYASSFYGMDFLTLDAIIRSGDLSSLPELAPWESGLYPSITLKKKAYFTNLHLFGKDGAFKNFDEVIGYLNGHFDISNRIRSYPEKVDTLAVAQSYYDQPAASDYDVNAALSASTLACFTFAASFSIECGRMVKDLFELMHPVDAWNLHAVVAEVMGNPDYRKGLARAALKIHDRIVNEKFEAESFVFDDIRNAYEAEGFDRKKATDMTWKVMAVMATNGANTPSYIHYFTSRENYSTMVSIAMISVALYLGDAIKTSKIGITYSIPPSFQLNCEYGKSYHFWMTAFFSYYLRTKYPRSEFLTIRAAAYTLDVGYQLYKKGSGRDPEHILSVKGDHPTFNLIRLDLVMAASGAYLGLSGLESLSPPKINFAKKLKFMDRSQRRLSPLSPEVSEWWFKDRPLQFISRWNDIIKPQSPIFF